MMARKPAVEVVRSRSRLSLCCTSGWSTKVTGRRAGDGTSMHCPRKESDVLPAIDVQFGAVHVARGIAAQEINGGCNLRGASQPAHRHFAVGEGGGSGREDGGVNLTGRDRVHAHTLRREFGRHFTCDGGKRRFGGG